METDVGGDRAAESKRPREAPWTKSELDALKTSVQDLGGGGRTPWKLLATEWQQLGNNFPSRSASSLKHKWSRITPATSDGQSQIEGQPARAPTTGVSHEEHDSLLQKVSRLCRTHRLHAHSIVAAITDAADNICTDVAQPSTGGCGDAGGRSRQPRADRTTRCRLHRWCQLGIIASVSALILADALQVLLPHM